MCPLENMFEQDLRITVLPGTAGNPKNCVRHRCSVLALGRFYQIPDSY
jgi:hypothetical protein